MADIFDSTWSQTDSSNTNLWAENMAPSLVNNGGRSMQGAIKRWFVWSNATATSAGSANTQTLDYTVPPSGYSAGLTFEFIPGFTNTASATINVNSLGAITVLAYGAALTGGEIKQGVIATVAYDGANFQLLNPCPLMRTKLAASTTYYVDGDAGSDSTGIGTAGNPWQSIQFGYDYIISNIDCAGFAATISQQGTDTTGLLADSPVTGAPYITLTLNGAIATSNPAAIRVFRSGGINLTGNGTIAGASFGAVCQNSGFLQVAGVTFNAVSASHLYAQIGGVIQIAGSYSIGGNAAQHIVADSNGNISYFPPSGSITVTLDGTRAFTTFALASTDGDIGCDSSFVSFSGTATGARYFSNTAGGIFTNSGGSTFFPGGTSGTADGSTFGYYV